MNVVVELQKSATPKVVLNQLFKHTPLQSSFGFNMLALVPVGEPRPTDRSRSNRRCSRSSSCSSIFIAHRHDVVTRRTRYDLRKAEERAHLLEGYRIALDNIDEVIEIVRASQTTDEAKTAAFGALRAHRRASAGDRRHAPARPSSASSARRSRTNTPS